MIEVKKLSLEDRIGQSSGLIASNMDGEKVMLSIENGKYYNLGEIGGVIWDLIEKPIKINQLVSEIMTDYDVDQDVCKKEVIDFLDNLLQENVIKIIEGQFPQK